jgi:hypothetical protein
MTTDFRTLCAELLDEVVARPLILDRELIARARAALADEPAVPEGREPVSVTGQPSDEQLLDTLDRATADFPPRHPEAEGLNAVEYPLALELRKARAVLARWGNPAPQPPAKGEAAELVRLLGSMAAEAELADQVHDASVLDRAAELLQRLSPPQPVPVSERLPGEVQP